jgi:hypothetical protein
MDRPGFVTSSLCRGLANEGLAALEVQGARFASGLNPILRQRLRTKKDLRRGVSELARLGEAAQIVQVIGRTPNERDVSISQFVPYTVTANGGPHRKQLRFYLVQTMFSVRRGIAPGSDSGDVLEVDEHAVDRLFLRLRTLTLSSVADELRDTLLLALPLALVAERLSLRQLALPTSNGAFLCHYGPEARLVIAKTWLPADRMGSRWAHVRSVIRSTNENCGGEAVLARLLGSGMKRSLAEGDCGVIESLMSPLSKIPWLKEQYLPRPDHSGDIWEAAKRQAVTTN